MERHRFDPLSFVTGLLFAGIGVLSVVALMPFRSLPVLRWLGPLFILALGAILLLSAATRGTRDDHHRELYDR